MVSVPEADAHILAFPNVNYVPLAEVAGRMKGVPLDSDTIQTGRDLGISFGD